MFEPWCHTCSTGSVWCPVGHRTKLLHTEIVEKEPLQGGNDYRAVAHQVQASTDLHWSPLISVAFCGYVHGFKRSKSEQ